MPAFDILGAAYVVRDAAHLERIFRSEVGQSFAKLAREKLGVVILAPAYYGVRQLNLKGNKKIRTPEDLAGVKLRMPGGESWQFLGQLDWCQSGSAGLRGDLRRPADRRRRCPGQSSAECPLMKFHEVTNQIVLTGHNVGFGLLIVRAPLFDALTPAQQQRMTDAAQKSFAWSTAEYLKQEQELVAFFKSAGLDVYTPDVAAFRAYAQRQYLQSSLSKSWPAGHAREDQRPVDGRSLCPDRGRSGPFRPAHASAQALTLSRLSPCIP